MFHYVPLALIVIVLLAWCIDWINGFHDTANAIATVVSTGVLPGRIAVMMAAVPQLSWGPSWAPRWPPPSQHFRPDVLLLPLRQDRLLVVDDATPEAVNETQLQWLAGELRGGAGCEQRFVILHVPLYDPRGGKNNHCLPRETAAKLLEIFKTGKVSRVFAGHIHEYATGDWDGIPFVISGGAGAELAGNDPAHDFHHYLVVEVAGPKVAIQVRKVASSKIR